MIKRKTIKVFNTVQQTQAQTTNETETSDEREPKQKYQKKLLV